MQVNTIDSKNISSCNFNNSNNFINSKRITNNFSIQMIPNLKPVKKPHPKCKFTSDEDNLLKKLVTGMINEISKKQKLKQSSSSLSNEKENEIEEEISDNSLSPSIISSIDWNEIAKNMKTWRNARQCRERWVNYLSPSVVNGPWTVEEEDLLRQKYNELGPRWKKIALLFPTRTDINVKSHYHLLERRIRKEEKKKLKALEKQKELEESTQIEEPCTNISNNKVNEPKQSNIKNISSSPLPFFQIPYTQVNSNFAHPNNFIPNPQFDMQHTNNSLDGQISIQNQYQQISKEIEDECGSPLPIFSLSMQEADREYELNSNECWNSLLMNDESNDMDGFFEKWL